MEFVDLGGHLALLLARGGGLREERALLRLNREKQTLLQRTPVQQSTSQASEFNTTSRIQVSTSASLPAPASSLRSRISFSRSSSRVSSYTRGVHIMPGQRA